MAKLNEIDQHVQKCTTCMSQKPCAVLSSLVTGLVQETHGDLLAAAGEVKVSRFFHPGDNGISSLRIQKRNLDMTFTQEEAGAIELGINRLLHSEDD